MEWSKYNVVINCNYKVEIYNCLNSTFIEILKEDYDLISNNLNNNIKDETVDDLLEMGFIEIDNPVLANRLKFKSLQTKFFFNFLDLVIAPTTHCNFDCVYCFEKYKPNVYLNSETEKNILKFIKSFSTNNIGITWFGGEPLLGFDSIKRLTESIIKSGYNLNASMISNGYQLTKEISDDLENLNLNFIQITLDGIEEIHDKKRHLKNGNPTFKKIISNLDYLLSLNKTKVSIQVTIDENNRSAYLDVLDFIKGRFPKYFESKQITVGLNFVQNRNGNPHIQCHFNRESKANYLLSLAKNGVGKEFLNAYLYPKENINECMLRSVNTFGIGPDGNIYKCLEHFGDQSKAIGNINTGTFNNDMLIKYTLDADVFDDQNCLKCNILPICGGGCPDDRLKNKYENKKIENCNYFKDKIEEFLRAYYTLNQD